MGILTRISTNCFGEGGGLFGDYFVGGLYFWRAFFADFFCGWFGLWISGVDSVCLVFCGRLAGFLVGVLWDCLWAVLDDFGWVLCGSFVGWRSGVSYCVWIKLKD